jgi:group I intron endonuclease
MGIYIPTSVIYCATNKINGKQYIGYTENLKKRIQLYRSAAKTCKTQRKFYNAIQKYGIDNFTWEIIYESWDNKNCLSVIEMLLIKEFDTYRNGYNSTPGGECNPHYGKDNGMFGKTHTAEVKQMLRVKATLQFKDKSYEDLYGKEKADILKEKRSKHWLGKDHSGSNNTRYDHTIYNFINVDSRTYTGTRYNFLHTFEELESSNVHNIICKLRCVKGWSLELN